MQTGAMPRTPSRLPEDVTALAERDAVNKDTNNKNSVAKTYHSLKDLISSKFKKDTTETIDELNNSTHQIHKLDEDRSPYSALPIHMRQIHGLNQSQPNIWNGKSNSMDKQQNNTSLNMSARNSSVQAELSRGVQQRAISQPQLNISSLDRGPFQNIQTEVDRRGSLTNIDVTDSDDGGFVSRPNRPQTVYQINPQINILEQTNSYQQSTSNNLKNMHLNQQLTNHPNSISPYQHSHLNTASYNSNFHQQQHHTKDYNQMHNSSNQWKNSSMYAPHGSSEIQEQIISVVNQTIIEPRKDMIGYTPSQKFNTENTQNNLFHLQSPSSKLITQRQTLNYQIQDKQKNNASGTTGLEYDIATNQILNSESGRTGADTSTNVQVIGNKNMVDIPAENGNSNDDGEWVDIVDAELRHILEPGVQNLSIRPGSTISGSASSISPPLPPLSPDGKNGQNLKVINYIQIRDT